MSHYDALPSAEAASGAGPGDRCRLSHFYADNTEPWTWGAPLPQRLWRVTKGSTVAFEAHGEARFAFGTLSPGDWLRYEATYWFGQGCDNEPNVCDRFVVLTGALAGHCVSTRGVWEPDRTMLEPVVDSPMDPPDPPVAAILERAARLTPEEAAALDAALRANPPTLDVRAILDEHQRWLNNWAMFDRWADPAVEMRLARERVDAALGIPARSHAGREPEPDDGTVVWGAGTAAAQAVLASGRTRYSIVEDLAPLRAAWEAVMGTAGDETGAP